LAVPNQTSSFAGGYWLGSQFLGARVFDTNMYGIYGKYVFDLGGGGLQNPDGAKFTLSGGFVRLDFSNPTHTLELFKDTSIPA
jgi:hypothetical protein